MGRTKSQKNEKREQLFGNYYYLVKPECTERFSPYVDSRTNKMIAEESKRLGVSKADYLLYRLLSADMDKLLDLKCMKPELIRSCKNQKNVIRSRDENGCFKKREGDICYSNPECCRSVRISMRLSSCCKKEIERRAEMLSLQPSEYVAFVFLYHDFCCP